MTDHQDTASRAVEATATAPGDRASHQLATAVHAALTSRLASAPPLRMLAIAVDAPGIGAPVVAGFDRNGTASSAIAAQPFRIASVAKAFVAAAVHQLIARRQLALHDSIAKRASPLISASLTRGSFRPDEISIAHLLSHTSGLIDHSVLPAYSDAVIADPDRRWTRQEQVDFATANGSPLGPPGAIYAYSDTGYIILGDIIEQATGQSLAGAIPDLLAFDRLGLTDSWWENPDDRDSRARLAEQWIGDLRFAAADPTFDLFGGGGLVSTVGDLAKFIRALMTGEVLPWRQLSGALVTPAATPAHASGRTHSYLLASMPVGHRWVHGHTGFWGSSMIYCAELDVAVAATANMAGDVARDAVRGSIADALAIIQKS